MRQWLAQGKRPHGQAQHYSAALHHNPELQLAVSCKGVPSMAFAELQNRAQVPGRTKEPGGSGGSLEPAGTPPCRL